MEIVQKYSIWDMYIELAATNELEKLFLRTNNKRDSRQVLPYNIDGFRAKYMDFLVINVAIIIYVSVDKCQFISLWTFEEFHVIRCVTSLCVFGWWTVYIFLHGFSIVCLCLVIHQYSELGWVNVPVSSAFPFDNMTPIARAGQNVSGSCWNTNSFYPLSEPWDFSLQRKLHIGVPSNVHRNYSE